jgi:hypothetical protein
MGTH